MSMKGGVNDLFFIVCRARRPFLPAMARWSQRERSTGFFFLYVLHLGVVVRVDRQDGTKAVLKTAFFFKKLRPSFLQMP